MEPHKRWLGVFLLLGWLLAVGYLVYAFRALPSTDAHPIAEGIYTSLVAVVLFAVAIFFLLLNSLVGQQRRILELLAMQQKPLAASDAHQDAKHVPFAQWLLNEKPTTGDALAELARMYSFAQSIYYSYSQETLFPKEAHGMPIYKARSYHIGEDLPGEVLASKKPCFIEAPNAHQAQPIESGLGKALPKMLALLPLLHGNGQPVGLLEASLLGGLSAQAKKQLAQDAEALASFLR